MSTVAQIEKNDWSLAIPLYVESDNADSKSLIVNEKELLKSWLESTKNGDESVDFFIKGLLGKGDL